MVEGDDELLLVLLEGKLLVVAGISLLLLPISVVLTVVLLELGLETCAVFPEVPG